MDGGWRGGGGGRTGGRSSGNSTSNKIAVESKERWFFRVLFLSQGEEQDLSLIDGYGDLAAAPATVVAV